MSTPRILTAATIGLSFQNLFGELGPETRVSCHYTAGPRDTSDAHAAQLCRQYHAYHRGLGWGGIAYHYCITRKGTLLGLRPTSLKGAHTARQNSNSIGVMVHGTTGQRMTKAQRRTLFWLLRNAHKAAMPRAHRTDKRLYRADIRGHKEWPGQATSCPGAYLTDYHQIAQKARNA